MYSFNIDIKTVEISFWNFILTLEIEFAVSSVLHPWKVY